MSRVPSPGRKNSKAFVRRRCESGCSEAGDLDTLEHMRLIALLRYVDHRATEVLERAHVLREKRLPERIRRAKNTRELKCVLEALDRLDESGPEEIDPFARKLLQIVFGFSFHPGPHAPPLSGAIGPQTRYVAKRHVRVEP